MTKVQNPIIGRAKGSAGGMTFSKNYDKNVMRAKAFEVNNPNTQAQQTQRGFFAELQEVVGGFTPDQLRFLFPSKPKTMSRRNALSKQIAESNTIVGTTKSVDFADVITLGNAPTMDFGTTTVTKTAEAISITLDPSVANNAELLQNDFFAVLVNETQKQMVLPSTSATIEDDDYSTSYPSGWLQTDTIHAIPLISDSVNGSGAPHGFGTMVVIKRPVRPGHNPRN